MGPSVSTKTGAAVVGPSKIGEGGLELLQEEEGEPRAFLPAGKDS
jgi:hypothetical protein